MSTLQYASSSHPNLQYTLHPLISQLNMELVRQSPHNPLQFIKLWATKKIKQIYSIHEDQSEQEELENQAKHNIHKKIATFNAYNGTLPLVQRIEYNGETTIKRRNAVVFAYNQKETINVENQDESEVSKNEQTNSRILISLKNDIFFKNLSWEQINDFATMGKVFETKHENQLIQCAYENITRFFIIVSGEVYTTNTEGQQVKTYYTGESLCHQSFLYSTIAQHSYYAREAGTLLFILSGQQIKQTIEKFARQRYSFYEKVLMNKEEFNYLDAEERDKVIRCFKERKEIMQGEVVFRGEAESSQLTKEKRFYVVVKGVFSKCKKNSTGELVTFKQLRQGDYFGEQNLLSINNIDYTVMCLQDNSELAYFDKNSLESIVDDYSRIVQRCKMQVKYLAS